MSRKLPTTKEMLDQALHELQSRKGISLIAIKKFIESKYELEISKMRNAIIKSHLRTLLESSILMNVTGHGLTGRMRLAGKNSRRTRGGEQNTSKNVGGKPKTKRKAKAFAVKLPISKTPVLPEKPHLISIFQTPVSSRDNSLNSNKSARVERKLRMKKKLLL